MTDVVKIRPGWELAHEEGGKMFFEFGDKHYPDQKPLGEKAILAKLREYASREQRERWDRMLKEMDNRRKL